MNPHLREVIRYIFLSVGGYYGIVKEHWNYLPYFAVLGIALVVTDKIFIQSKESPEVRKTAFNIRIVYMWIAFVAVLLIVYHYS